MFVSLPNRLRETTYYMPNFDKRARNDDHLKFAGIFKIQSHTSWPRYGFVKRAMESQYGPVSRNWMLEITANFKLDCHIWAYICRWKGLEV